MSHQESNGPMLPDHVRRLATAERFGFGCHSGLACFTECCRELELALTPYDVLRLKQRLGLQSSAFLQQYVVVERADGVFPRLYLGMVDDGRASCPFVGPSGCEIYADRPGACRAYPLGRAASLEPEGGSRAFHVLITEPHCHGFGETDGQTVEEYTASQGLTPYNASNDAVMQVLQHDKIKNGLRLTRQQADLFLLALYDLDRFRNVLRRQAPQPSAVLAADDALLRYGIEWLQQHLFGV